MARCFVIQPFDSGRFDKRFDDVYKPAIESAGLEAYRVDRDPKVEIPIEAIEGGIRNAVVCLADITTDNPNVWFELGYALASNRPVVMVSEERTAGKYPFDIQHRAVINYKCEAPSDFQVLRNDITNRLIALLKKGEALRQIAEREQVAPTQGLSQLELMVLAVLAGETSLPGTSIDLSSLKLYVEISGLTPIGFSLGLRRLTQKGLIEAIEEQTEEGYPYSATQLTHRGWEWVEQNEPLFVVFKEHRSRSGPPEDEIPF